MRAKCLREVGGDGSLLPSETRSAARACFRHVIAQSETVFRLNAAGGVPRPLPSSHPRNADASRAIRPLEAAELVAGPRRPWYCLAAPWSEPASWLRQRRQTALPMPGRSGPKNDRRPAYTGLLYLLLADEALLDEQHLAVARECPQIVRDYPLEAVAGAPHVTHCRQHRVAHVGRVLEHVVLVRLVLLLRVRVLELADGGDELVDDGARLGLDRCHLRALGEGELSQAGRQHLRACHVGQCL